MSVALVVDDVEVAQPEEVHLEQPELFDTVHLVLRDDRRGVDVLTRSGLRWTGEVLGERLVGDDHGGGVDAVLAAQALEACGHVDDLLGVVVGLVHPPQIAGQPEPVLVSF